MRLSLSAWVPVSIVVLSCAPATQPSPAPAPAQTAVAAPPPPPASGARTTTPTLTPEQAAARDDSLRRDREFHVNRIREQIKGKEELPAEEVFQNIKLLKSTPAGRLLNIMAGGYSGSLGVSCSHCHVTSDFAKEDKPQKQVTREMVQMAAFINDSLLKKIDGIQSENPGVNCGTCHNGRARPGFGPRGPQRAGTGE